MKEEARRAESVELKIAEYAIYFLLGIAIAVAAHQIITHVMQAHGWKGLTPADWAAWVQAVGATAGIGIAVWLPYKQKSDAIKAEEVRLEVEISRLKTAIGEELAGFFKSFYFPFPEYLMSRSSEMIFDVPLPIYEYHFPVYLAVVDRLTLIPDDGLRTKIADAYRTAGNLLSYSRENNRLLDELRQIEANPNYRDDDKLLRMHTLIHVGMRGLCSRMREICGEVPVRARSVALSLGANVMP